MHTFRNPPADRGSVRPNLVVGWASGLVQVWPNEDPGITPATTMRRFAGTPLGSPTAVLDVLAAADGQDRAAYARRHAAEAGAVLALTHHTEPELLAASVEVRGTLSPSRVLAVVHAGMEPEEHRLAS